jgi:hypothetical protein
VYVERFGQRYLTVFNDSDEPRTITLTLQTGAPSASRELVSGRTICWNDGKAAITLQGEDVAVVDLNP